MVAEVPQGLRVLRDRRLADGPIRLERNPTASTVAEMGRHLIFVLTVVG